MVSCAHCERVPEELETESGERFVPDARGAESFYGCVRTALSMEEMNRIARTQRSDQTWHEKITPAGAWAARTHAYRTAYAAPPRRVNGSGKYRD